MRRWSWCWCVLLLLAVPVAPAAAAPAGRCFAETGFCVAGGFLAYWDARGGLARNGYPLTPERRETLEDGREYTVQYFERVRLEYHPENAAPYDVLLGQFGRTIFHEEFGHAVDRYRAALAPVAPKDGATFFAATGHNVAPDFYTYWQTNGGLAQLGYPLAEEQFWPVEGTRRWRVQYFERGRLEAHPENAPPYDLLLGQFGVTILTWRAFPLATPFGTLYRGDASLRERLGPADVLSSNNPRDTPYPVEIVPFEHGLALRYRSGFMHLLCGTEQGYAAAPGPGQLPGVFDLPAATPRPAGGPGPRPGTYEPGGDLGLYWQGSSLRECVGYATAPTAALSTAIAQTFARGYLIALPERGEIFALYTEAGGDAPTGSYFQRYPLAR